MGNSQSSKSSRFDDDFYISTPASLDEEDIFGQRSSRRTSGAGNFLSPPTARHHRRSRSANAAVSSAQEQHPPPPPYSAAVNTPPPTLPPRPTSSTALPAGSRHTNVFSIPAPTQSSQNPFRNISVSSRNAYLRAPIRRGTAENVLETLRKFNTVFIVDDSRSMLGPLWLEARNALASLADTAAKYDADGIDLYFLNNPTTGMNLNSSAAVRQLFERVRPRGITPIGEKLEELLLEYLGQLDDAKDSGNPAALKAIKPVNYIVITDGAPTDDPESVIVNAARRLDARNYPMVQVGIQFVQIGDSPEATEYLNQLDDGLASNYGIRDIVDTTPYTGGELTAEILTKILIGGINRRVDVRGAGSVLN